MNVRGNPVINNDECYVAFLDILGFKNLIKTKECTEIIEIFNEIINRGNIIKSCRAEAIGENKINKKLTDDFNKLRESLFIYIMSDSIVLAIKSDNAKRLHFLLYVCDCIQKYLFDKCEVLLRGGVSSGRFYGNTPVAFGDGFLKAYNLQENCAVYPRVIIDPGLVSDLKNTCNDYQYKLLEEDDYQSVDRISSIERRSFQKVCKVCKKMIDDLKVNEEIKRKYRWILGRLGGTENIV